jgi:hypothetical protein
MGCPYACNFCIDWNNPYRLLPTERLAADLRYASAHLPGVMLGYQDPNFAVKFDQVLDVMESLPQGRRNTGCRRVRSRPSLTGCSGLAARDLA